MSNSNYLAVTPSDSVALSQGCGLIYVGVTGDVAIKSGADTDAVTLKAVPVGWLKLPFAASFIMATGTSATNLVACPKTVAAFAI